MFAGVSFSAHRRWLLLAVLVVALPARAADVAAEPETYDIESYDVDELLAAAESGKPFTLRFARREHTVRVERNDLRSERFTAMAVGADGPRAIVPDRVRLFKGEVVGEPGSVVRLTFTADGIKGYIQSREGWTYIDPLPAPKGVLKATADGSADHRVYNEADLDPDFHGVCQEAGAPPATTSAHVHGTACDVQGAAPALASYPTLEATPSSTFGQAVELVPQASEASDEASYSVLEVAVVADYEYFQRNGANTTTQIETILNTVEGIYESELGITLEVVSIVIWEQEEDPYTTTVALDLLLQLRNYWNANRGNVARDVVHLFSGKNLDNATVGIAYVGVVSDLVNAYTQSQDVHSTALAPLLVAHEIGHTLGALHDEPGSDPRYIMYASLGSQNLDQFSDTSKTAITNFTAGAGCMSVAGDANGSTPAAGGGGGGGGGGPVDPLTLAILLAGAGAAGVLRSRRGR